MLFFFDVIEHTNAGGIDVKLVHNLFFAKYIFLAIIVFNYIQSFHLDHKLREEQLDGLEYWDYMEMEDMFPLEKKRISNRNLISKVVIDIPYHLQNHREASFLAVVSVGSRE